MKLTYTGGTYDLAPAQIQKIEEQFTKVAKILDGKAKNGDGEQEAHVRISQERHLHNAEVTVNFHHHSLVGKASDPDLFTAIHGAVHKLEARPSRSPKSGPTAKSAVAPKADAGGNRKSELVIITGLSGSGKGSVLKVLEDLGYYSVDNLPIDLIPKFADLTRDSETARLAALVVDIREGEGLKKFPAIFEQGAAEHLHAPDFPGSRGRSAHAPFQRNAPPASAGHWPLN